MQSDRPEEESAFPSDLEDIVRARRCQAVVEAFPDAIIVTRLSDQVIVDVNRRFCEVTGVMRGEAIGATSAELGLWSASSRRDEYWHQLRNNSVVRNYDFALKHRNGQMYSGLLSSMVVQNQEEDLIISVFKDITILRRAEEALQRRLGFEELVTNLSSRFINLPAEEVDLNIESGLKEIRDFMGVDRAGLLEVSEDGSKVWLSHRSLGEAAPLPFSLGSDLVPHFPWLRKYLVEEGKIFCAPAMDVFPEEGHTDRVNHEQADIHALLTIPVLIGGRVSHLITVNSKTPREWPEDYIPRLRVMGEVFVNAIQRRRGYEEEKKAMDAIRELKDRLQAESDYLRMEIESTHHHSEIIGGSPAIRQMIKLIDQVAQSDSHVLITGETGTGKELVAKAIHGTSKRQCRSMVIVNCASLPASLIEGELFGREKGAFTGALTKQIGRFEFADNSTIFLDEIGELPIELQSKLLRVLQQGEFERLGSPRTVKVNARIIAATNRDLSDLVRRGEFRKDLYYRLSVFPIEVPPLRERAEDVPTLVWSFIEEFSKKMGKKVDHVSQSAMAALQSYSWPGNVRELRNTIERSMIQTHSTRLEIALPQSSPSLEGSSCSLEDVERNHILQILERTNWRIKGLGGAADILDLRPSTLYSRMEKLGISRRG